MRFKDFLLEAANDGDPDETEQPGPSLRELIDKSCPGLIKRLGGHGLLYRGVSKLGDFEGSFSVPDTNENYAVYSRSVRKDRKPMSTHPDVHAALDRWFEKKFGWKARSQGLFVFGERGRNSAEGYGGKNCIVFPVGKFSYVWSPVISDLYHQVDGELNYRNDIADEFKNSQGGVDMEKLDDYMTQFKYTNNGLHKAIETDHEIMIDCDEALFIQYYGPGNVNHIAKAVKSTREAGYKKVDRYD